MLRVIAATLLLSSPALAEGHVPPLDQMIDESIGYMNVAPGLVMIEDSVSSHLCRVRIPDAYFDAYANADIAGLTANPPGIICVPTPEVSGGSEPPFDRLIDESIGYVNVAPGLVMIEDEVSSNLCRVRIPDAYFDAYAAGDEGAMAGNPPNIVCVPTPEVAR